MERQTDESLPSMPKAPVHKLTRPFVRFMHVESASGLVLLTCTIAAIFIANTSLSSSFTRFWKQSLIVGIGDYVLSYPLWYWINDGLMAIFFFVIGLEIKRELVRGELSDRRKILLPIAAAIGGATVPALLYLLLRHEGDAAAGWAIPMATDIAFVVGCLALLGKRVPHGLKIFCLTLAIVDDIIAVLIIALFYSQSLVLTWAVAAIVGLGIVYGLSRLGVRTTTVYVVVGSGIWLCTLKSGIHPTIAGVVLGLMTPASAWIGNTSLLALLTRANRIAQEHSESGFPRGLAEVYARVSHAAREAVSPLERLEVALHPWVGFVIMPAFALVNAGVPLGLSSLGSPVSAAIAVGLIVGKPMGIVLTSWLVVRSGHASLPSRVSWSMMVGAGCLAGIGFTMSLFIASLSLQSELLLHAKAGIMLGSFASAVLGMSILLVVLRRRGRE